jgi:hypothetical protein
MAPRGIEAAMRFADPEKWGAQFHGPYLFADREFIPLPGAHTKNVAKSVVFGVKV